MPAMQCTRVDLPDVAEAYVTGRLIGGARDAFEAHFFECDRCFAMVRMLQALQAELGVASPAAEVRPARSRRLPQWMLSAAAVAITAGLGVWFFEAGISRPVDRTPVNRPSTTARRIH